MKKNFILKLYPKELFFAAILVILPTSLALEMNFNTHFIGYSDEFLCIICSIYVIYLAIKKRIRNEDYLLVVLTVICTIIGLIGNIRSRVITNWFPVAVDVICLAKIFFPFIIYKQIAQDDKNLFILRYILFISKALIIVGTAFGILSLFFNMGMTIGERYGIQAYAFIFRNEGRYGYIVAACLIPILSLESNKNKQRFYELLAVISMLLTTKGVVYIVIACYIILVLMWRNKSKLSLGNIITMAIGGVAVSTVQINSYLRDSESPRMTLIKYSFETANTYFPFGSGFATYGSDMAARAYSKLYVAYGFEQRYGLSREVGNALNDCYMGMVFGQFGYVGAVVFAAMLVIVFIIINKISINKKVKALAIALFIGLVISSIGTAIIKSSIGVFIFSIVGLCCGYSQYNEKFNKKAISLVIRGDKM